MGNGVYFMRGSEHLSSIIKLFCFPYAGGSASVYGKLKQYLDKNIEIVPIEYTGRGKRINEKFYTDISGAIDDIYEVIRKHINGHEFAFLGHSMGCIIAYEICKRVREDCGREPAHIFVSGRYPPHVRKKSTILHTLPNDWFKNEIMKIGGTPKEIFENEELSQLFIPILKADYRLVELYEFQDENVRFNSRITVLSGKDDKIVEKDELYEWQKYSLYAIDVYEFDGGHFFINNYVKEIAEIINHSLDVCSIPV